MDIHPPQQAAMEDGRINTDFFTKENEGGGGNIMMRGTDPFFFLNSC